MNHPKTALILFMTCVRLASCQAKEEQPNIPQEVVLSDGQWVEFKNANGGGQIRYESPLRRTFRFDDGTSVTLKMVARKRRFLGKLGLYNPGNRWFFEFWKGKRIVAEEAEVHFESLDEARKYLVQGSAVEKWVYNDQGYVVGYFESSHRNQVNITLYRFYVKGEPLLNLPGFNNGSVIVGGTQPSKVR